MSPEGSRWCSGIKLGVATEDSCSTLGRIPFFPASGNFPGRVQRQQFVDYGPQCESVSLVAASQQHSAYFVF